MRNKNKKQSISDRSDSGTLSADELSLSGLEGWLGCECDEYSQPQSENNY